MAKEEKVAKFGQDYYDQDYFEADVTGGKEYRHPNGSIDNWGYHAKQLWSGWKGIIEPLRFLFRPERVLDVGCGTGSFVREARRNRLKAWGIDFSEWAIENALDGAEKWIKVGDARDIKEPDDSFDFEMVTDLMEHIYKKDVDAVIDGLYRVSNRWVFLQIATVGMKDKPAEGYILKEGEPIPLELEAYAVAGHVTVQPQSWWEERLVRPGWRSRPDLVDRFRRLVDPKLIVNWRTILIEERWP